MKVKYYISLALLVISFTIQGQSYDYEPSSNHPFGQPHPEAPSQVSDFGPMIGLSTCKSVSRNPDGTWADTVMMDWKFKYIMNGWAVQDETLKEDGRHSGSIRQFNQDSARWYVHYYASASPIPSLSTWEGSSKNGESIVLYREQKAPNGMDGYYRITFDRFTTHGYHWAGEWVNPNESIVYPTWRIFCTKIE